MRNDGSDGFTGIGSNDVYKLLNTSTVVADGWSVLTGVTFTNKLCRG
jgi:hypothetical protein